MSIEERFNAAVNVIRGLPKNGPYQPSNDMLLRFYSYFKQATKGKCSERKPAFWDVVNRAKWDAWNRLNDMPKEVAMQKYVDELKKIVETMSYTDNVANFMEYSMSDLDNVNINDLEMVAPEAIKKARSRPNSPFASREASPGRLSPATPSPPPMMSTQAAPMANGHVHKPTAINGYHNYNHHNQSNHMYHHHQVSNGVNLSSLSNGASSGPSEMSDDEYIDTYDDDFESETNNAFRPFEAINHARSYQNGTTSSVGGGETIASGGGVTTPNVSNRPEAELLNDTVAAQITRTIECLNASVQQINSRVSMIEKSVVALRDQQQQHIVNQSASDDRTSQQYRAAPSTWWPFAEVSPAMMAFIILWPLVINRITSWAQRKKT